MWLLVTFMDIPCAYKHQQSSNTDRKYLTQIKENDSVKNIDIRAVWEDLWTLKSAEYPEDKLRVSPLDSLWSFSSCSHLHLCRVGTKYSTILIYIFMPTLLPLEMIVQITRQWTICPFVFWCILYWIIWLPIIHSNQIYFFLNVMGINTSKIQI